MEQLIFFKQPKLPRLKLESVMPLLEYLHGLPQEPAEDRELSPHEDETRAVSCCASRFPKTLRDWRVWWSSMRTRSTKRAARSAYGTGSPAPLPV